MCRDKQKRIGEEAKDGEAWRKRQHRKKENMRYENRLK